MTGAAWPKITCTLKNGKDGPHDLSTRTRGVPPTGPLVLREGMRATRRGMGAEGPDRPLGVAQGWPTRAAGLAGHRGISLLALECGMPGFHRGRNLDKIGMKAHDTAELFFDEGRVPKA